MDHVELAMVLAVDGSASVNYDEFGLIAGGMAAALRDPAVVAGLTKAPCILSLLLWSGPGAQAVITDWTRVSTAAELEVFATEVDNMPRLVKAGETAIGEALLAAITLFAHAPAIGKRSIVNVIGDGRSNAGIAPGPIRDKMAAAGMTINGLCILHEEPDLLASYEKDVIGGPGAFAVVCRDYPDFQDAMRRKLLQELGAKIVTHPPPSPTSRAPV